MPRITLPTPPDPQAEAARILARCEQLAQAGNAALAAVGHLRQAHTGVPAVVSIVLLDLIGRTAALSRDIRALRIAIAADVEISRASTPTGTRP